MSKFSLYIHIPFCVSKCSYCDFCSFVADKEKKQIYVDALCKEIADKSKKYADRQVYTVYIGGGTPSVLPENSITQILDCVRTNYDLSACESITIEANPNSFDESKASEFASAGCDRLSLGLQAINPKHLALLNRKHDFLDCVRAVRLAKNVGINDINIDIMIGIPTQTIFDVKNLVDNVLELPITHISAYSLINEPNTPLTQKILAGKLSEPDPLDVVNMYDFVVDYLAKFGFLRYEISNFSKLGYESKHNLNYWHRKEYLGVGLGAFSFMDGTHWENTADFNAYLSNPTQSAINIEKENLTTAKEEFIMLALRTAKGLNIEEYNTIFNADFLAEHRKSIDYLVNTAKLLEIKNGFAVATNFYMTNTIISKLFEFV